MMHGEPETGIALNNAPLLVIPAKAGSAFQPPNGWSPSASAFQ